MSDVNTHRNDGTLCTTSNGSEIIHRGHLCEGANVTPANNRNFLLWWRCGRGDVPANAAHEGNIREVTCPECLAIWNEENGQFGVGA